MTSESVNPLGARAISDEIEAVGKFEIGSFSTCFPKAVADGQFITGTMRLHLQIKRRLRKTAIFFLIKKEIVNRPSRVRVL
jgi:hypothetical protein